MIFILKAHKGNIFVTYLEGITPPLLALRGRDNDGIPGALITKLCRSSDNEVANSAKDGYFLCETMFASQSIIINDLRTKEEKNGRELHHAKKKDGNIFSTNQMCSILI